MPQPRSSVLAALNVAVTSIVTVVTCPAGKTLLVKQVNYQSQAGTAGSFVLRMRRAAVTVPVVNTASLALNTPQQLTTNIVLEPGDSLELAAGSQPLVIWVSGSVLTGVPAI